MPPADGTKERSSSQALDGQERGEHNMEDSVMHGEGNPLKRLLRGKSKVSSRIDDPRVEGSGGDRSVTGRRLEGALMAGSVQHTAHKQRLAIDTPKYEYATMANLTRTRSADESLWQEYTEPSKLPKHATFKMAKTTAPYGEEVLCAGASKASKCRSVLGLPMLRPEGLTAVLWKLIMSITDVTYTAFLVPLSFAYFHDVRIFNWMSVLDIVGSVLYLLDVLFSFHIGFVLTKSMHARLVLDGRLVAKLYVRHSTFVLDILAALPLPLEVALLIASTPDSKLKWLSQFTSWLRLVRLLRLYPMLRSLVVLSLTGHYNRKMLHYMASSPLLALHVLYMYLFLANLLDCIWYYTAVAEGLQNSWLRSVGSVSDDLTGASGVTCYIASFYFVTTFLSTVGFGDITPTTTAERVVATVMMFVGITFFGFLLGVMQTVIQRGGKSGRRADLFRSRLPDIEAWMKYAELPSELREKIRAYYAHVWTRHEEVDERLLFDQLPHHLRGEVATFLTDDMLKESRAFGSLDNDSRRLVAAMFRPVPTAPGHDLYPQGASADCLYVLQDGELAVYRNTIEIERIGAPYLIGELAILNALAPEEDEDVTVRHPVCVRAMSLSMLWELRMSDLQPLMNSHTHLKHDLCCDVIEYIKRLQQQQPHERVWINLMKRAQTRLSELEDADSDDADSKSAEPEKEPLQLSRLSRRATNGETSEEKV